MQKSNLRTFILLMAALAAVLVSCKPQSVNVTSISTNSELIEPQHKGKYIYPAVYAFDDNINTSWSEANFDYGKNTFLKIEFESPALVDEIKIINGFAQSEKFFLHNNRVKNIEIEGENFKKTFTLADNVRAYQSVKLPSPVKSRFFKFTIKTIYHGKCTDTLITDIKLMSKGEPVRINNFAQILEKQKDVAMSKALKAGESSKNYFEIVYAKYNATWYCEKFGSYYTFRSNGEYEFRYQGEDNRGSYKVVGNWIHLKPLFNDAYGDKAPLIKVTFKPYGNHTIKINDFKCKRLN